MATTTEQKREYLQKQIEKMTEEERQRYFHRKYLYQKKIKGDEISGEEIAGNITVWRLKEDAPKQNAVLRIVKFITGYEYKCYDEYRQMINIAINSNKRGVY